MLGKSLRFFLDHFSKSFFLQIDFDKRRRRRRRRVNTMRIPSSSSWLLQVGFQSFPGGEWVPYAFSKPPAFAVSFCGEKKLQLLLRFGRIRKRWAATAGHKTILEGGTAVLLFLISFPKAPWTTSRSSRVENQVFVSSSSLILVLRLLSQDELRPTLFLPRCLVLHPRRLHTFLLLVMPRPPPLSCLPGLRSL